jgi:hypothetical protein
MVLEKEHSSALTCLDYLSYTVRASLFAGSAAEILESYITMDVGGVRRLRILLVSRYSRSIFRQNANVSQKQNSFQSNGTSLLALSLLQSAIPQALKKKLH